MTDEDILAFVKTINDDVYLVRNKDCLVIYYNGIKTNIEVVGKLDNATDWTLQTLKFEIENFLKERDFDKLIEEKSHEHKRVNKGKPSSRRKTKSSKSKDRL